MNRESWIICSRCRGVCWCEVMYMGWFGLQGEGSGIYVDSSAVYNGVAEWYGVEMFFVGVWGKS